MDFSTLLRAAQSLAGTTAHLTGEAFGPALGNANQLTHTLFDRAFPSKLISPQDDPNQTNINQSYNLDRYGQPMVSRQPSPQDLADIKAQQDKDNGSFGFADSQAALALAGLASNITQPPTSLLPSQPSQPSQPPALGNWQSRFQQLYNQALSKYGLDPSVEKLLVTSENGKEDPTFQNFNYKDGQPISVDTGLTQINTPVNDPRITQLKDPSYNIDQGLALYKQRLDNLGDPLLALASYNLGASGAATNPLEALQRAQHLYQNAQLTMPQTDFAKDPQAFISKNQARLKGLGILH